jgi:hypothetical protein
MIAALAENLGVTLGFALLILSLAPVAAVVWSRFQAQAAGWQDEAATASATGGASPQLAPPAPTAALANSAREAIVGLTPLARELAPGAATSSTAGASLLSRWGMLAATHQTAAELLRIEAQGGLDARVAALEQLEKQVAAQEAEGPEAAVRLLVAERLKLWRDVQTAEQQAAAAAAAFEAGDYAACREACAQHEGLAAALQKTEAASLLEAGQVRLRALLPRAVLRAAYAAVPQEPPDDRRLGLERFLSEHESAAPAEEAELIAAARQEWQTLEHRAAATAFLAQTNLPLSVRLPRAAELYNANADAPTRDRLRAAVTEWLHEALEPRPLPEVPDYLQETRGEKFGNIILGIFREQESRPQVYQYWESPEARNTTLPRLVTDNPELVDLTPSNPLDRVQGVKHAPAEPLCVKSVRSYNQWSNWLLQPQQIYSKERWQEFVKKCETFDAALAESRNVARKTVPRAGQEQTIVDVEGVYPKEYARLYQDLTFRSERQQAQTVVDHFDAIAEMLLGAASTPQPPQSP